MLKNFLLLWWGPHPMVFKGTIKCWESSPEVLRSSPHIDSSLHHLPSPGKEFSSFRHKRLTKGELWAIEVGVRDTEIKRRVHFPSLSSKAGWCTGQVQHMEDIVLGQVLGVTMIVLLEPSRPVWKRKGTDEENSVLAHSLWGIIVNPKREDRSSVT